MSLKVTIQTTYLLLQNFFGKSARNSCRYDACFEAESPHYAEAINMLMVVSSLTN